MNPITITRGRFVALTIILMKFKMCRTFVCLWFIFFLLTAANSQVRTRALSNDDVIQMTSLGLSDDVIIEKIRSVPATNFDTSVAGLKVLKAAKVSEAVLKAMINPRASSADKPVAHGSNPAARTMASVSGRIFGIDGNGNIKPARFAHVYLLYGWSGKPKAPGAKDDDSHHAYWAFLDKQNAEMEKKLVEKDFSCRRGLLVFAEAVSHALRWTDENGRPKEFMSVDTDEEGSFKITGVPAGYYFLVVRGRAGPNDAVWTLNDILVKPGTDVSVKLSSPEESCLALPE
jgi:hypothetical protein